MQVLQILIKIVVKNPPPKRGDINLEREENKENKKYTFVDADERYRSGSGRGRTRTDVCCQIYKKHGSVLVDIRKEVEKSRERREIMKQ